MKGIFLCLYLPPEPSSSKHLLFDVVETSAKEGFENLLLAPNPVRGLSKEEVRKNCIRTEEKLHDALLIRLPCFSFGESSYAFRFVRVHSFIRKALAFIKKQKDVAFVYVPSNPPILWALSIEKLARKMGFKVIYNINDIYPDIVFRKGSFLYRLLNKKAIKALKSADQITTLSEDMKDTLLLKGVVSSKIHVIPPWEYQGSELNSQQRELLLSSCNLGNGFFNVCYIGNIGKFQNMSFLIKAASLERDDSVHFHIIGGGRELAELNNSGFLPDNLFIHDRVSENEAKFLYSVSAVNVISLNPGIVKLACPSKTPLCLLAEKPIIVIVDPDSKYAQEMKDKYNAYVVDPKDPSVLPSVIASIKSAKPLSPYPLPQFKELAMMAWGNLFREIRRTIT